MASQPSLALQTRVTQHYDLTDKLLETILDPRRQYFCVYFHRPDDRLETAQETKLTRLADARKTAAEHSLEDRLDFALHDYMLESVGSAAVPAYFRKVGRLLAPGGVALIHSIAVHD